MRKSEKYNNSSSIWYAYTINDQSNKDQRLAVTPREPALARASPTVIHHPSHSQPRNTISLEDTIAKLIGKYKHLSNNDTIYFIDYLY